MMLNQTSQEAHYTATFVDNYLDCVENCPDDLQRRLTRMRELDVDYRACIREVEENLAYCIGIADEELTPQQARKKARAYNKIHRALITSQEVGDEKLQVVQQVLDDIELKSKQLDADYKQLTSCIDYGTNGTAKEDQQSPDTPPLKESNASVTVNCSTSGHTNQSTSQSSAAPQNHDRERDKNDRDKTVERASKRARRTRTDTQSGDSGGRENDREPVPEPQVTQRSSTSNNTSNTATNKKGYTGTGKKKKRKARAAAHSQREETPPPEEADAIDPDEPTYCLCDQISFGEMILCDNDLCPIEWFHFSCVSLTTKPKGKWFCPKCRGDRPNIMKPKGQFLKELERYNKEKEEKA